MRDNFFPLLEPAGFRGCVTKMPLNVPQPSGSSIGAEGFNVDATTNVLNQFFSTGETPATRRNAYKKLQLVRGFVKNIVLILG